MYCISRPENQYAHKLLNFFCRCVSGKPTQRQTAMAPGIWLKHQHINQILAATTTTSLKEV